ncbi:MAG TPA: hypothetical protein VN578_20270 [Candidatus Binatia bacterium]|jgi:hypothetical protein|nr:hypothetical protein [Candidatus Binatia bacterium]
MNGEDQFERRLQRLPQRPVPHAWRDEILSATRAGEVPRPARVAPRPSLLSNIRYQLSTLLWPHPKAWGGLAALWLLVLGLNFATRESPQPQMARHAERPSPQIRELLKEQEQLFAELVGPIEKSEADRPKPAPPKPRSQRHEEFLNA